MIVGPDAEGGGILPVTGGTVALGHLSLELPSMGVCMALLAFTRRGSKESNGRSLSQDVATNARNRCVCTCERIGRRMLCDVIPRRQEAFLVMTIGASCMAGEELSHEWVSKAGIALTRHRNESTHPCVRVGWMAFDTRHNGMGASQGIGLCMASYVELSGFELPGGVAVCAIRIPTEELSAMRVCVTTFAGLWLPRVADRVRIGISLTIRQPGTMALLASHGRVGFIERKTRLGVGLRLDAAEAFRPGLVRGQMTRGAVAGPSCAVWILVAVRAGGSFYFVESHPHVIDVLSRGVGSMVRGRHRVAVGARGVGMSALQHIVVIVPELNRRSKRLLAVTEFAGTGQSPGVDVFVTIGAVLRQSQIGGATRL